MSTVSLVADLRSKDPIIASCVAFEAADVIDGLIQTNSVLMQTLRAVHDCLNANFSSPDTIEGRRAISAMNLARLALDRCQMCGWHHPKGTACHIHRSPIDR